MVNRKKCTKESILAMTKGGILFYKFVIPELEIDGAKCRNVQNPFYNDKNGSLSIYYNEGQWYFKDFGDESFRGDVFQFSAYFLELDIKEDFPEILERMNEIDFEEVEITGFEPELLVSRPYELVRREEDKFSKIELKYFAQYGITESVLLNYSVLPINGFKATNSKGKAYSIPRKPDEIMLAYSQTNYAKIYRPEPKQFWYVGEKKEEYVFGKENAEGKIVIITGGEKDVLTLASLGYDAICLGSETAYPSKELLREFYEQGTTLYTFLDNDETGIKQSKILMEKYGIKPLQLPKYILNKEGKDISDYVKNGLKKKLFDKAVSAFLNNKEKEAPLPQKKPNEKSMENIPDEVFNTLPSVLKSACNVFELSQEKSMILLATLTALGGIFKNIYGNYDSEKCGTNLYLFVVAPPSSGKGALKHPRFLGQKIHKELMSQKHDDGDLTTLFIPGDNTSAAILKQLHSNEGRGIIWEPEADTLSGALGRKHGDFSNLLRASFHHEPISSQRKTNQEYFEIDSPSLGIVLSGTPDQVRSMIPNTENGLFSRFMFFDFKPDTSAWKRVFEKKQGNRQEHFLQLGNDVYDFYMRLDDLTQPICFTFSPDQQEDFYSFFDEWQKTSVAIVGDEFIASIRRLAVICFRIGMILSACRLMETTADLPVEVICTDEDFVTCLCIANCLKAHALSVYEKLGIRKTDGIRNQQMVKYYESLPEQFDRKLANKNAEELGIPQKTAEGYLAKFRESGILSKPKHGEYAKS